MRWPNVTSTDMNNPYKGEKKDEWEKLCEKYGEEDKSKLTKADRENSDDKQKDTD